MLLLIGRAGSRSGIVMVVIACEAYSNGAASATLEDCLLPRDIATTSITHLTGFLAA